ncbi:MAG: DnaD domain protein [Christensenellaceae bacterium]|jgi:DNA replication protein DnaD|nr:DnaD domain protein [Christensenellaceae bacterium]
MPSFRFAEQFALFDVTPLENLFIEEYMLRAPGDYVKVYVYALRLCYHPGPEVSLPSMAMAMGLEEESVLGAFTYWERMGLLRRVGDNPLAFSFFNLKEAVLSQKLKPTADDLPYREFNTALQELFGERILQSADYMRVYGWIEELGLEPDAVLELVAHMVKTAARKSHVGWALLDKEARNWAKNGIKTKALALAHLRTLGQAYEGARRVLRQLGLNRSPTVDEERLFQTWTESWGFSLEAVLTACGETTKISNPNFAYIGAVLSARRDEKRQALFAQARALLQALGESRAQPSADFLTACEGWLGAGFTPEALLLAAKTAYRQNRRSPEELSRLLSLWQAEGLKTKPAIEVFLQRRGEEMLRCETLLRACGAERRPTPADLAALRAWVQAGASEELMLLAAEYARHSKNPFGYMAKVLENWLGSGIFSAEAARAARESAQKAPLAAQGGAEAPASQPKGKTVSAQRVPQRSYSDAEFESLYADLGALLKEESP